MHKVVSLDRHITMTEVAIPRTMFKEILRFIAELRSQPQPPHASIVVHSSAATATEAVCPYGGNRVPAAGHRRQRAPRAGFSSIDGCLGCRRNGLRRKGRTIRATSMGTLTSQSFLVLRTMRSRKT